MLVELLVTVLAMSSGSAEITHVAPVAPDIIGITISTGHAEYGEQIPYKRQEGDRIIDPKTAPLRATRWKNHREPGGKGRIALVHDGQNDFRSPAG